MSRNKGKKLIKITAITFSELIGSLILILVGGLVAIGLGYASFTANSDFGRLAIDNSFVVHQARAAASTVTFGLRANDTYTGSWQDMAVQLSNPNTSYPNDDTLKVTPGFYGHYLIDISALPDNIDITSAKLHIGIINAYMDSGFTLEMRSLSKPLTSADTWNKYNGVDNWTNQDGGLSDSALQGSVLLPPWSAGWQEIPFNDLTYLENNLTAGSAVKLMLYPSPDGVQNGPAKRFFYSSESTDAPYLEITYTAGGGNGCTDGQTQQCGTTDIGECSYGVQTCANGAWGSCVGAVEPATEICGNGFDEDCNGADLACGASQTYYVCGDASQCNANGGSGWSAGNDSNNCASKASPCLTISKGISKLSSDNTLIIGNGAYTSTANNINNLPSGTGGPYGSRKFTTIKADVPFYVTVGDSQTNDATLNIDNDSYIHIDGLVFLGGTRAILKSDDIKITRCGFGDVPPNDCIAYNLNIGNSSTYVLVEDSFAFGSGRYKFGVSSTQTDRDGDGVNDPSKNIIFRRDVSRADYYYNNPNANCGMIAHFSNYQQENVNFQNSIAIDGLEFYPDGGASFPGFMTPNGSVSTNIDGSMVLNIAGPGIFAEGQAANGLNINNTIIWGSYAASSSWMTGGVYISGDNGKSIFSSMTSGHTALPRGWYSKEEGTPTSDVKNTIFYGFTGVSSSYPANRYDAFYCSFYNNAYNGLIGANAITAIDPISSGSLKYLPRIESGSPLYTAGEGGAIVGATMLNKIGVTGTFVGDPGWNTATSESLWPWPYQDDIERFMCNPQYDNYPGLDEGGRFTEFTRGFCAPGKQLNGVDERTLTSYIWEYLGNPIPAGYDNPPPPPPAPPSPPTCTPPQILCSNECFNPVCSSNSQCNDNSSSTTDTCVNPNTCSAACFNQSDNLTINFGGVSNITTNSAVISWTTNLSGNSVVEYGPTASYGSSKSDNTLTTIHSINLTGLTGNTTYHFRVSSMTANGSSASGLDRTITTASPPPPTPPPAQPGQPDQGGGAAAPGSSDSQVDEGNLGVFTATKGVAINVADNANGGVGLLLSNFLGLKTVFAKNNINNSLNLTFWQDLAFWRNLFSIVSFFATIALLAFLFFFFFSIIIFVHRTKDKFGYYPNLKLVLIFIFRHPLYSLSHLSEKRQKKTKLLPDSYHYWTSQTATVGFYGSIAIVIVKVMVILLLLNVYTPVKALTSANFNQAGQFVNINDQVTYKLRLIGDASAVPPQSFSDPLPSGLDFVPGSLVFDETVVTDAYDNDQIYYNAQTRTIEFKNIPMNVNVYFTGKVNGAKSPVTNVALNVKVANPLSPTAGVAETPEEPGGTIGAGDSQDQIFWFPKRRGDLNLLGEQLSLGNINRSNNMFLSQSAISQITDDQRYNVALMVAYGLSDNDGYDWRVRLAALQDFEDVFKVMPTTPAHFEILALMLTGHKVNHLQKNLLAEIHGLANFIRIYRRLPDFKNIHDDMTMQIMSYRLRIPEKFRNLNSEKDALKTFGEVYGRMPQTSADWAIHRAITYGGAKK